MEALERLSGFGVVMINCLIGGLLNMPLDEMGYDGIDTSHSAGVVKSTRFEISMFKLHFPLSFIFSSLGSSASY